jgi:hypothetical protein
MHDPGDFEDVESPRVAEFNAITDTGRHAKIKHTERFFFCVALHLYHFKCVDHHFSPSAASPHRRHLGDELDADRRRLQWSGAATNLSTIWPIA